MSASHELSGPITQGVYGHVAVEYRRFAFRAVRSRVAAVALYAMAMGYVEAAAVLYIRTVYGGVDPLGPRHWPVAPLPDLGGIEIGREAATLVMLAAVGWLAGRRTAERVGAFLIAFGLWDVWYYVFMWLFTRWPATPLAPDVLFLIPLPWWGPVLAPALIALVMAVGGGLMMARAQGDGVPRPDGWVWLLVATGGVLCLTAFLAGALAALPRGVDAAFATHGGPFPWPVYLAGLALGMLGLLRVVARGRTLPAQESVSAPA